MHQCVEDFGCCFTRDMESIRFPENKLNGGHVRAMSTVFCYISKFKNYKEGPK
jgi:hypothetical protein